MAKRPKLEKPQIRRVQIKVQQYLGKQYEGGEAITVYDTTKENVMRLIEGAMRNAAQPEAREACG